MENFIIGLTGTCCAGKNHVAGLLEDRGLPALDVDKLGHSVIDSEKTAITERFGQDILNSDGSINRKLLGARVFGKKKELLALEAIVHPGVIRMIDEWLSANRGKPCVINAALLHKAPVYRELKAVILVSAPLITRLLRAKKRDKFPWTAIFRRFFSQRNFMSQYIRENTDIYRVENRFNYEVFPGKEDVLRNRINEILTLMGL